MEDLEKLANEAVEKGISVEELTGKPIDFSGIQDSCFQQIFCLTRMGETGKAAEMEAMFDRWYC